MNQLNGIKITTYFGHALHWIKLSQNFDRKIASMMRSLLVIGKNPVHFPIHHLVIFANTQ